MRQKIISFLTLAAMTLLSQGAWADNYVIFSMTNVTSLSGTGVSENVVPSKGTATVNATFTNGSAIVFNGHASTAKAMVDSSSPLKIDITGSGGSYFKVTLTAGTIQAGDIISFVGSSYKINISHTNSTSSVNSTSGYVVPENSPLIGCSSVYVFRETGSSSYAKFSSFTISRPNPTVTLDNHGYATFASVNALDLANMSADSGTPVAYKASVSGSTVNFSTVSQAVQANTGILLVGDANSTVTIPIAASGTDISTTNDFKVNTGGTTFTDDETNYYYFAMKKNQSTLTFGTFAPSSLAIPANKAYLKVAKTNFTNQAPALSFTFGDDNQTTGVNEVRSNTEEVIREYYNLNGQRVSQPTRGLYIVNGKKVIIK